MEVATLIPQIQDTLSEISITINELCTKAQDDELDRLEQERERLLAELQASFDRERQEIETKRQTKLEGIKQKRKREDEDRLARRRQEDQELEKANLDEDTQWQKEYDDEVASIEDKTSGKIDEIEEVARKIIQDGKQKLRDLDEKRRVRTSNTEEFANNRLIATLQELNRRIDEQLKQSVPTAPSRNKDRKKKGHDVIQRNGTVGDPTSIIPQIADLNTETSNKPDTPSKPQPPSATDSPTKSSEAKKDGELLSQGRSNGPSQVAKDFAKNLPISFAEALKRGISNRSKNNPEIRKPNFNKAEQTGINHGERGNEMTTIDQTGVRIKATVPTSIEHVKAQDGGAITSTETKCIKKESKLAQNIEPFPDIHSQLAITTNNSDAIIPHGLTISNIHPKLGAPTQQACNGRDNPISHEIETGKLGKGAVASGGSEVSSNRKGNGYTENHLLKEAGLTVGDSKSALQSSRLSTASQKRDPRRHDKETHSQVGLEQSATPDLLEQDYSGDVTDFSHTLNLPAPRTNTQGEVIAPIVGERAREKLALPLPVENETVHGQDRLFDDDKSASGPSEPHIGDEYSVPSPIILPLLQEPAFRDILDDQGPTLINGSGSWAILAHEADEDSTSYPSSKIPSRYFDQLDTEIKAVRSVSRIDDCGNIRLKANISEQPTRQDLSPIRPTSPNHDIPCVRDHGLLHLNRSSRTNDQGSNSSKSVPVDMMHTRPLSDMVSLTPGDQYPTVYDVASVNPAKTKNKLRSHSIEPHPKRPRQRGRPRKKSFESPERALNPRELLFQGSEGDINIRSPWFKRSKRGMD
ncbi:hypothetical protein F4679DRAFT_598070 [Xylaria curta]|nr:hypothetical protein F4679DRAFT_598070 [Xylaria curta]